jgi:hypothetical protein
VEQTDATLHLGSNALWKLLLSEWPLWESQGSSIWGSFHTSVMASAIAWPRGGGSIRVDCKTGLRDFSTLSLRPVSLPDPNEVAGTVLSLDVDIDSMNNGRQELAR